MYFVFDENLCKFEGMTKEQIIAAIAEATGATPTSIDDAFITKIKETNRQGNLQFWKGTSAEYALVDPKDPNTFYIVTDDATIEDIQSDIEDIDDRMEALEQLIPTDLDGTLDGFTLVTTGDGEWNYSSRMYDMNYHDLIELDPGLYLMFVKYKTVNTNTTPHTISSTYRIFSSFYYKLNSYSEIDMYYQSFPSDTIARINYYAYRKNTTYGMTFAATLSENSYLYRVEIYAKKLF